MTNKDAEKKVALKVYAQAAGLSLLEIMLQLEQDGYSYKFHSRSSGGMCRYSAQVYRMDDGGGGKRAFSQSPTEALTEAWASAARCRVRRMREAWREWGTLKTRLQ